MLASLTYPSIADLTPGAAAQTISALKKYTLQQVVVADLLVPDVLQQPVYNLNTWDIFTGGIYVFFDDRDNVRYVGKSKNGFYLRLMSQLDTTHRAHWGWNALLRKLGGERTGKPHHKLTTADHEKDLRTLLHFHMAVVTVDNYKLNEQQLGWLEKYLMKGFRELPGENLLNTRTGKLHPSEKTQTLKQLIGI